MSFKRGDGLIWEKEFGSTLTNYFKGGNTEYDGSPEQLGRGCTISIADQQSHQEEAHLIVTSQHAWCLELFLLPLLSVRK